jgi:hypothetical protein
VREASSTSAQWRAPQNGVVIEPDPDPLEVVTAYRTSNVQKY